MSFLLLSLEHPVGGSASVGARDTHQAAAGSPPGHLVTELEVTGGGRSR